MKKIKINMIFKKMGKRKDYKYFYIYIGIRI